MLSLPSFSFSCSLCLHTTFFERSASSAVDSNSSCVDFPPREGVFLLLRPLQSLNNICCDYCSLRCCSGDPPPPPTESFFFFLGLLLEWSTPLSFSSLLSPPSSLSFFVCVSACLILFLTFSIFFFFSTFLCCACIVWCVKINSRVFSSGEHSGVSGCETY